MLALLLAIEAIENENEKELVKQLFFQYHKYVYAIALEFLQNEYDAEDMVIDVFFRVIAYREKFVNINRETTKTLLVIYTKSACYNFLNKRKRENTISLTDYNNYDYGDSADLDLPDEVDILETIIKQESLEELNKAIDMLDYPEKDIIRLKYFYDTSNKDIAALFDMNPLTVGTILFRSKQKLKKHLGDYIDEKNK